MDPRLIQKSTPNSPIYLLLHALAEVCTLRVFFLFIS